MKAFAALFAELDASTGTTDKVDALKRYFALVSAADAAWAVYFLAGGKEPSNNNLNTTVARPMIVRWT